MDDVPLCPTWWPDFVWWLLHRPRGPGPIGPLLDPRIIEATESLLIALHGYHLAPSMGEKLRPDVQRDAVERMQEAVAALAQGRG
jgi:hypothetical protein